MKTYSSIKNKYALNNYEKSMSITNNRCKLDYNSIIANKKENINKADINSSITDEEYNNRINKLSFKSRLILDKLNLIKKDNNNNNSSYTDEFINKNLQDKNGESTIYINNNVHEENKINNYSSNKNINSNTDVKTVDNELSVKTLQKLEKIKAIRKKEKESQFLNKINNTISFCEYFNNNDSSNQTNNLNTINIKLNNSIINYSLRFKYSDLLNDFNKKLLLPPLYKELLKKFKDLDEIINLFKIKSKSLKFNDLLNSNKKTKKIKLCDFQRMVYVAPHLFSYRYYNKCDNFINNNNNSNSIENNLFVNTGIEYKDYLIFSNVLSTNKDILCNENLFNNKDDINNNNNNKNKSNNNFDFVKMLKMPLIYNQDNSTPLSVNELKERTNEFKNILTYMTYEKHEAFLKENNINNKNSKDKCKYLRNKTWHSDFNLYSIDTIPFYKIVDVDMLEKFSLKGDDINSKNVSTLSINKDNNKKMLDLESLYYYDSNVEINLNINNYNNYYSNNINSNTFNITQFLKDNNYKNDLFMLELSEKEENYYNKNNLQSSKNKNQFINYNNKDNNNNLTSLSTSNTCCSSLKSNIIKSNDKLDYTSINFKNYNSVLNMQNNKQYTSEDSNINILSKNLKEKITAKDNANKIMNEILLFKQRNRNNIDSEKIVNFVAQVILDTSIQIKNSYIQYDVLIKKLNENSITSSLSNVSIDNVLVKLNNYIRIINHSDKGKIIIVNDKKELINFAKDKIKI